MSSTAWKLELPDGVEVADDGTESALTLDSTFNRCDGTYEMPDYGY